MDGIGEVWRPKWNSGGPSGQNFEPRRVLSAPKRPKGTQERLKGPPETTKKRLRERLGALLRRFGRVLGAAGASRGGPGSPKWMQNKHKIVLKRVSVTVSGPDLVFHTFLIVVGVRRYSKVFKLYLKNGVILNIRIFHSQDTTMQKVSKQMPKHLQHRSTFDQNGAQTVPDAIWKDLEGSGGQNGSSGSVSKSVWERS